MRTPKSLNCKFRDERLNERRFKTPVRPRTVIDAWHQTYNEERQRSALTYLSRSEFAVKGRATAEIVLPFGNWNKGLC
jgi:hypothetical protein